MCAACQKCFATSQALRLHQFRKHEVSSTLDVKNLDAGNKDTSVHSDSVHRCSACRMTFKQLQGLKEHECRKHETVNNGEEMRKSTRKTATRMNPNAAELSNNPVSRESAGTYVCAIRPRSFTTNKALKEHQCRSHQIRQNTKPAKVSCIADDIDVDARKKETSLQYCTEQSAQKSDKSRITAAVE